MFELTVRSHFSAAHKIEGHLGKCRFLHGHNWKVEAVFWASETDEIGIALDFSQLKSALNEQLQRMDHICLNDLPEFSGSLKNNPTAENLSKHIYQNLVAQFRPQSEIKVKKIIIWETDNCASSYFEEN